MSSGPGASVPNPSPPPTLQRVGLTVLIAALVLLGLWILQEFLSALAWAGIFAIALWPLYRRLTAALPERGHVVCALFVTALVMLVFVAPVVYLAIALTREMHVVIDLVVAARRDGISVPDWVGGLPVVGAWLAEWWRNNLADPQVAHELFGRLEPHNFSESAREYGREIVHRLTTFVFMLLTLFFLFRDGSLLARQMRQVSDRVLGLRGEQIAQQMIAAVHGTVSGLVLVGLAEGVVLGIVYFAVGLPHPVLVSALTGVLAVIPFGAPVVFGAAALYLLAQGNLVAAIVVGVAGFVVTFVADHLVRPFLIGGAARLPFLWVLLGILGGLRTIGFLGLFLGPAVLAALISLWREWTEPLPRAAAARPPALPAPRRPRGRAARARKA
jgi:predicted PurR-regulated permease PerM